MVLFAKVKSGHDKNHIYMVMDRDENRVLLVNGTTKPLAKPKKKNPVHIQIIRNLPEQVCSILEGEEKITDSVIEKALKEYNLYLSH